MATVLVEELIRDLKSKGLTNVYVGFSGGIDSSLLLAVACKAFSPEQVVAVHVNHQLSANADHWQQHCREMAGQLGCAFECHSVTVENQGQGVEAAARRARYEAFAKTLPAGATLLLGQHLDDQIETFFLRLFRGAGVTGLQGMSAVIEREHYQILRPLLQITRSEIEAMAAFLGLSWVIDDSNADLRFDRNYLRHAVMPLIEERWPAYRQSVQRAQQLVGHAVEPQQTFDVATELEHRLSHDQGLKMVQLDAFSRAQKLTLIHAWLSAIGQLTPSAARLEKILDEVVNARSDANPEVIVGSGAVRRHGPALYWVKQTAAPEPEPDISIDQAIAWPGVGMVELKSVQTGPRLRSDLPNLHLRRRMGGESMRPYGRSRSRDLKRLFQEYRIKPWLRDRVPLLYSGNELVAAGNDLLSADHLAEDPSPGIIMIWQKSD